MFRERGEQLVELFGQPAIRPYGYALSGQPAFQVGRRIRATPVSRARPLRLSCSRSSIRNRYGVPLSNRFPRPATTVDRGPLATTDEIAVYLGVPVKTLYQWKYRGIGPRVHKVGRHLRYRWREVDAWLDQQTGYDLTV